MFVLGDVKTGDILTITNASTFKTKGTVINVSDFFVEIKYNNIVDKFDKVTGIKTDLRVGVEKPIFAIPQKFLNLSS